MAKPSKDSVEIFFRGRGSSQERLRRRIFAKLLLKRDGEYALPADLLEEEDFEANCLGRDEQAFAEEIRHRHEI